MRVSNQLSIFNIIINYYVCLVCIMSRGVQLLWCIHRGRRTIAGNQFSSFLYVFHRQPCVVNALPTGSS